MTKNNALYRSAAAALALLAAQFSTVPAQAQTLDFSAKASGNGKNQTVVTTAQVRAELVAHAPQGVQAGKPLWVGLKLAHKPEWHTYWKNSGDSGLPTTLEWKLPAGVTAGDIAWPTPHKIPIGNLANYGYENTLVLPVPLTVPANFAGDVLTVGLQANWLVCKQECIPEEGSFTLNIPARGSFAGAAADFEAAFAQTPKPSPATASFKPSPTSLGIKVSGLPPSLAGKNLHWFPEVGSLIQTAATPKQTWAGNTWTLEVPLDPQRSAAPAELAFVVAPQAKGYEAQALRVVAKLDGAWTGGQPAAGAVSAALSTALSQTISTTAPPVSTSFWVALVSAVLGGLILNLMPCVFPVLALKVFAVIKPGITQGERRSSALAYTAGVVASMLALAGLMLALRAGGEAVGWGFQLQSPAVVAGLAALFTLLVLNFAGVFEFGSLLPSGLASAQARNPVVDSALSGVLAVAVASPCTAPFMGASLGFAAGLPAPQALAIFAALGLGLALPFLVVGFVPAFAKFLPRPGAWMDTVRRLMAFPMAATVVWLVWVLGQQTGIDGAAALLMLLVGLAFVVWSLAQTGKTRAVFTAVSVATTLAIALTVGPKVLEMMPEAAQNPQAAQSTGWQPWAPGKVEQLMATGQPVFVDFTAAWCVTCQFNKQNALADNALLADMGTKNVARLRADWTRRDPAITQALSQLGRNGVPVYVLYKAGRPPVVFGEVLSAADVREAVSRL